MKRLVLLLNQAFLLVALIILTNISSLYAQAGGNVLKLGGTNGYVEVPGLAVENGGPITIEFWSYVAASDVKQGAAFTIGGNSTNNVQANVPWDDYYLYWDYGSTTTGRSKVDYVPYLNKWTHVALVSEGNGGGFKGIYLDGVLQDWSLSSDGPDVRVSGLTIGKNGSFFHRGVIDEFRIWNVVRTEDEIFLNRSGEATGFEQGLAAVFHFNETAGATTIAGSITGLLNGVVSGDASIVTQASLNPAPYVLTSKRLSPVGMQTSATNVTFRVTFSEPVTGVGAPDFGTTVTGQLSAGTITVATISTTVYDVKVPVDGNGSVQLRIAATASIVDASGKQCDKEIVNGEEYWITQARFLSVWPQSGVTVNSTKVSYELPMRLTSGTATWTRTGGTADPASPHVQALSGDERNDGVHESITLANNPVLVNGAIYIITFNGVAWDGQVAPEFSITDIFFDRSFTYAEPDPAFNPGEGTIDVRSIALQTDNKIIIGGGFTDFDGTARNHVARLNSDGSLDASFDPGSGANNLVSTVLVQPDSKILIAGMFTQYNETNSSGIVRVNPDGSLDNTFNSDIGNLEVSTIVLQGDKVVIGGYSFLGLEPTLVRLNANGSTDDSFDVGEGPEGRVTCMFAQPDGKVMVGGRFGAYKSFFTSGIVRVNTDGAVSEDFYFDYDALDFNDDLESITAMVSQGDGKIIVSALSSFFDGSTEYISRIFRLNADGTADETFNIAEIAIYDLGEKAMVNAMQLQQDGKILIVGYFEKCNGENRYSIARLNADGTLDQSFYPNPGADNSIYALQTQTDGNILIGGGFSTYNSQYAPGIARIDPVSPIVVSSVRHTPTTPTTNATSVTFRVTFSEPVTDVGVNDFIITQSGEITYGTTEVIGVSGAVYDVTVSSITGVGTLRLDVPNTASISDVVGNSFDALFETGESYNIGKGDQTITLEAIADKTEGDDAFTVTATSSSGLPVTISAVSDKVSIAGSVVTIHAAGRVSIMANQPGNDDYNAAPPVEVGFCIKPARPVITASLADPTQPVLTSSAAAGNQWYLNNASIAAATDKSYTVTAPGAYKVQAQVNDCISEFSADYVLVITGLLEDIGEKVTIYPNPARDIIAVKGITPEEKLRVIGVTGNTYDVTPENGDGLPTVNIAGLTPGVYVLQVTQQENVRTIRFIKE